MRNILVKSMILDDEIVRGVLLKLKCDLHIEIVRCNHGESHGDVTEAIKEEIEILEKALKQ